MAVIDDPVLTRFRSALDAAYGDRIERVVLFGSRARGDHRPDSDYDVAVFLKNYRSFGRESKRLAEIEVDVLYDTGALIGAMAASRRRLSGSNQLHGRASARRHRSVKPETAAHLARATVDLGDARTVARLPLARMAARSAYYAAFHAAEALISERTGKVAKTHRGVQVEFSRLTKNFTGDDRALPRILVDGYRFKELADYGTDPSRVITDAEAAEMIADASRFVDRVAAPLSAPAPDAG